MTAEQFAYWMQGFAELNTEPPTAEQWQSIREHLATVFVKVTPSVQSVKIAPTFPGLNRYPGINLPFEHVQVTC